VADPDVMAEMFVINWIDRYFVSKGTTTLFLDGSSKVGKGKIYTDRQVLIARLSELITFCRGNKK
jgi:hypothetical protein